MTLNRFRRDVTVVGSVVLFTLVAFGARASAHAELLSTDPAANAILDASPAQIVLTFNESVNTVPHSIRLVASDGSAIELGEIGQEAGSDTITATVPSLSDGSYVVAWRAVSADSHPVSGAFTFSVRQVSPTAPGLIADLLRGDEPNRTAEGWLAVGRTLSYIGIALLVGGFVITIACAPELLATRRAGRLLFFSATTAIVGTIGMIAGQALLTIGSATAWGEVFDSRAGRWWFIRLGLVVAALIAIAVRDRFLMRGWASILLALGATILLMVVAAGGHGVSGRLVPLGFLATTVHLAAMCVWVGGLGFLAVVTPYDSLWRIAARFSTFALVSVSALAITGGFNAWRQASSWTALRESNYGTWLVVKLVLLGGVLAAAAVSRWLVTQSPALPPALRKTVLVELAGIVLVFGATAGLVGSAPPRATASRGIASATVVEGDRIAQLTLDPSVTGGTTMHVYITSAGGSFEQPTDISVTASLPSAGISHLAIPITAAGPGHATTDNANLPIAGKWTFVISVRYSEFDRTNFTIDLTIR